MKEEIASIVLGEIQELINRLEKLEQDIPQHCMRQIDQALHEEVIPKIQRQFKTFSQEHSQELYKNFKYHLDESTRAIAQWDREVIDLLQLTRRNYWYLFGLAFFSGLVGACAVLCVQMLMQMQH